MTGSGIRVLAPAVVAFLAIAPVAGGCGSDDTTSPGTAVETTAEPPGTEPPATDPPTTDPPATDPPTTDPPATTPPAPDPPATEPPATTPPATDPPATDPPAASTLVNVYWAWEVQNTGPATAERMGAGARTVPGETPVRNALEALFAGTNSIEDDIGMLSVVPAGTRVLGIAVDGTTATVDLSGEFENSLGGTLAETVQLAQVVFTVTQFDGFDRVKFNIDGEPRDEILSHGVIVGDGLTRDDFDNVRALIMIEGPYPGQEVGNPLVVRGESSTFEATIQWTLTTGGGDGLIVAEGFATSGGSLGTFLPFEFEIDLTEYPSTYLPGPGSIILYESSPEDGSQTWIVEIPIVLPTL